MGGLLGLISFGIGASLGAEAVRVLGEGTPTDVRAALKAAVRAWDTLVEAAGEAQQEFASFQAEAQAHQARTRARSGRPAELRRIPVTRE